MKKTIFAIAAFATFAGAAYAQEAASPITGNITLATDYRFRGISQTAKKPTIQGGFDYAHSSGLYLGNWNSNVSGDLYPGGSIEMDFYGGYKFQPVADVTADIGVLYYYYPNASYANGVEFNNGEIYFGAAYKWFAAKYFYGVTDFFGVRESTFGLGRGDSKGSGYLDLSATFEVAEKTTLTLHAGRQMVKNYGYLNYNDFKIGIAKDFGFATIGLAIIGTDADKSTYTVAGKELSETSAVLSIGKTF